MIEGKPIYVTLAQRRDVRKAQLEQQYNQARIATDMVGPPVRGPPLPGMFAQQPQYAPQFYAPTGPMGPQGRGPAGPPMAPMYAPMMGRGVSLISLQYAQIGFVPSKFSRLQQILTNLHAIRHHAL